MASRKPVKATGLDIALTGRVLEDVGNALKEIRDSRLYRQDFQTFEDYCGERWGFERRQAYRLIESSEVVGAINVSHGTHQLPTSERQARELSKLKEPEAIRETWSQSQIL